ncbi:pyridoxamine 5'-phosphate oxidase family protein [Actinocorallia sp. A-T 12471]|uniref:pyridoxamine 5'-phosphate oxidase family protein n=1 Tax=Actinocorallia sp. A-T 12471 TaxID=3089813 RepID=UPI0029D1A566|nr:pyridoxamine 5'-phosphate oxidase family protein [Actinocorallia sp. A-T 12471]MDX6741426.1 pyridoxamine 5'-phosphate oxidase family protein [Actinocorallia sp. A-T 12471]
MTVLPDAARALIDAPEFAVLATGTRHQCVMWVGRDGDELFMVTKDFRRQARDVAADPRVSVVLYARDRPQHYARIEGVARVETEGAVALMDRLALAYTGRPHVVADPAQEASRVVLRITPEKVAVYGSPR